MVTWLEQHLLPLSRLPSLKQLLLAEKAAVSKYLVFQRANTDTTTYLTGLTSTESGSICKSLTAMTTTVDGD